MRQEALIVAIEGLEGSGKSTVIARCCELLSSRGIRVACVPEFSDTMVGAYLIERVHRNRFLLDPAGLPSAWTQIFAVAADTALAFEYTIPSLLANNDVILKDRYRESIVACQHVALAEEYGLTYLQARQITAQIAARLPDPATSVIWLEASLDNRRTRVEQRGDYVMGDEKVFALREQAYRWLMNSREWDWRATPLDADAPLETVAHELLDTILTGRR